MRAALLVVLLTGCTAREVYETDPPVQSKEEFKDIPVQRNRDLDILFVVDDSSSMEDEQATLAANFPVFTDVLEALEGGLPNVHIGVVSSSLEGCESDGDGGALLVGDAACRPTGTSYIRDVSDGLGGRTRNYPGTLAEALSCNATLGATGCDFEQHLESMRRALDGSNPGNAGFLRDDAYLMLVIIADGDDCSTEDPAIFEQSPFSCFQFGVECDADGCAPRDDPPYLFRVREYVDFLKSLKDDDSLILVSLIVGPPEPVEVIGDDAQRRVLAPSCQSAAGSATPAIRLTDFARQFPNRNAYTTICNDDLSDGLAVIGGGSEPIGNPCIEALLVDVDPDQAGLQYECSVSDVLDPGSDDQEETLLPFCNQAASNLPCWHLVVDRLSCPETPTGMALVVERGGANIPAGTHIQARCRTE